MKDSVLLFLLIIYAIAGYGNHLSLPIDSVVTIQKDNRTKTIIRYNLDSSQWKLSSRQIFNYSIDSNLVSTQEYNWIKKDWVPTFKTSYAYHNNLLIENASYSWSLDSTSWNSLYKATFDYDSLQNIINQKRYYWNLNTWELSSETKLTFNHDNKLETETYYCVKKERWAEQTRSIYEYQKEKILEIKYKWDTTTNDWDYNHKYKHKLTNGLVSTQILYNWNAEKQKWGKPTMKIDFIYNYTHHVTSQTIYTKNQTTEKWQSNNKTIADYDLYNNITTYNTYDWDNETKKWLLSNKTTSIYQNNILYSTISYILLHDNWKKFNHIVYHYLYK